LPPGKPLAEARGEIAYGASFIEWFAEEASASTARPFRPRPDKRMRAEAADRRLRGDHAVELPGGDDHAQGGPALAAGCTVVVKPAEQTPLGAGAGRAGRARRHAGGRVQRRHRRRPAPIGGELTANPIVRKLSFTGSTEVGRMLMAQCAPTVKKLSLELGGNAPFIVFDDADLDAAVEGAMISKYRNTGQTCVCANRLLVQDGVYDAFAEKLAAAVPR
jgi:succinate-semialdehyde dehydrogenase/glutarate-semialdehyde dehydrogenase